MDSSASKTISKEYNRYITNKSILDIFHKCCISTKQKYEMKNIVERWLLSKCQSFASEYEFDKKMLEEISEKKIAENDNIMDLVKQKINEFENFEYIPENHNIEILEAKDIKDSNKYKIIKYKNFEKRISTERFNILMKYGTPKQILIAALRYESVINTSQQWHISLDCYREYIEKYDVDIEGFASPFNSQILLLHSNPKFCSLFKDTDEIFGSLGDFFNQTFINHSVSVNPPFIISILDKMADKCIKECELAENTNNKVRFFIIMAAWRDSYAYKTLTYSKYMKYMIELYPNKHFYNDSNYLEYGEPKKIIAKFSSVIFVLSYGFDDNDQTYEGMLDGMNCCSYDK